MPSYMFIPTLSGRSDVKVPTTDPAFEYGTPGMAREMIRIFSEPEVFEKRIIVMGGDHAG